MRSYRAGLLAALAILCAALPGCWAQRQWEVMVENKSSVPCSFAVTLQHGNGSSRANVDNVAQGKSISLIVGSDDTAVQTVT